MTTELKSQLSESRAYLRDALAEREAATSATSAEMADRAVEAGKKMVSASEAELSAALARETRRARR